MMEKNIIIKQDKEYLLNKDWILEINKISKHIYLNYTKASNYSLSLFEKLQKERD